MPRESYQVPSAAEVGVDSLRARNFRAGLPEGAVIRRPLDASLYLSGAAGAKTHSLVGRLLAMLAEGVGADKPRRIAGSRCA